MAEIYYDAESVMTHGFPKLKKLGACSPYGEMTPFVWKGRLMRMELIDPSCATDNTIPRYAGIRDVETGRIISTLAKDSYFHSAYIEEDTAYVLGVDMKNRSTIRIYESKDLINWTNRPLIDNPGWTYYNTSLAKGPDGYVLALESDNPKYAGEPFTIFFARSTDLKTWTHMDPVEYCISRERYNGGPWMKYSEGWYYLISVTELPCKRYTNYIFRTKDFKDWYAGHYNPMLISDNDDRLISPRVADLSSERIEQIKHAGFNTSNSDIDMCDWNGKVYMNYLVGNQLGFYYMAEAEYDGTVAELLKSYFE